LFTAPFVEQLVVGDGEGVINMMSRQDRAEAVFTALVGFKAWCSKCRATVRWVKTGEPGYLGSIHAGSYYEAVYCSSCRQMGNWPRDMGDQRPDVAGPDGKIHPEYPEYR
jgi:hypothetical protein